MAKRMIIMLICLGILFGAVFGWYMLKKHKIAQMIAHFRPAATTISAQKAQAATWQSYLTAVGSITAIQGVDVSTQESGIITGLHFHSGTMVKKGDLLLTIDDRTEQAALKNYNAQLTLAKLTYDRSVDLYNKGAESKSTVDSDKASLQEAEANVQSEQAEIDYKHIKAPFSGKIGIRSVDLGQYISAGTTIASLQSLDPLYVQFSLPEQQVKDLKQGQTVEVTTDAFPDKTYTGTITALDSEVDTNSRSLTVLATIPNKELKLLPGMFAHIHVMLPEKRDIVVVPQTAISYNLYGDSIYVIKDGKDSDGKPIKTAHLTYIKTGSKRGGLVEVKSGVKAGDEVITSGQIKLDNGAEVAINNTVEP